VSLPFLTRDRFFLDYSTISHKVIFQELANMSVILGGWGVKINAKNNQ
jgi:hypothetical protein